MWSTNYSQLHKMNTMGTNALIAVQLRDLCFILWVSIDGDVTADTLYIAVFYLQVTFVLFQYISRHMDVLSTYLLGCEWVKVGFTLALCVCLLVSLAAVPSFVKKIPPPPARHSFCTHNPSLTNQDANTVFLKVNSGICRMLSAIANLFVCPLLCRPATVPLLIKARFLVSWKKWQLIILDGQDWHNRLKRVKKQSDAQIVEVKNRWSLYVVYAVTVFVMKLN